jgi:hypothetical protein
MLDELIFRINVGTLGSSAHVMMRSAARDDDGEAVRVRELDSQAEKTHRDDCQAVRVRELDGKAASARWDDCEAARAEFECAKPTSKRKYSSNEVKH